MIFTFIKAKLLFLSLIIFIVDQNSSEVYIKILPQKYDHKYAMKENNSIKHFGHGYELQITLPSQNLISFILKINTKRQVKFYKNLFTYNEFSIDLKHNFKRVDELYKFLNKKGSFQVDLDDGQIIIQVKKLVRNQVVEVGVNLGLKEIGINLNERPYEMLAADVQELKMDVFQLRTLMNINSMISNPQDKEDCFLNEKNQLYRKRDDLLLLLKEQRKKDLDKEYEIISKIKSAEKIQDQRLQKMSGKLENKLKENQKEIEKLKSQVRRRQNEMKSISEKMDDVFMQKKIFSVHKMKSYDSEMESQNYSVKDEEIGSKKENFTKSGKNLVMEKTMLKEMKIHQRAISNNKLFEFDRNSIQCLCNSAWGQLLLKTEQIPKLYEFHCQIDSSKSNNIIIGIVDRNSQRNARSSWLSGNAICLQGKSGSIHYGNKNGDYIIKEAGKGFKEKEIVTVQVDIDKRTVKWLVNAKPQATICTCILKDKNRCFVPYIEMYNKGDRVKFWEWPE